MLARIALALCLLTATAGAAEEPRTLLVLAHDNDPKGHLVYIFGEQQKCLETALELTVKYRIEGREKTAYFFCRAPKLGVRGKSVIAPNS